MFWFAQPVFDSVGVDSPSVTVQASETFDLYQPFVPSGDAGLRREAMSFPRS